MELNLRAVWLTWVDAHDGDESAALGHLLLVLDRAHLLEANRGAA